VSGDIALVHAAAARDWMLRKRLDKLRLKYVFLASLVLAAATWLLAGILGGGLWWLFGWFLALGIFVLALAPGGHRDSWTARSLGRDVSSPTIDGLAFRAAHVRATPYAPASFRIQGGISCQTESSYSGRQRARNK
jgi:hypothetical protein